MASINPTTVPTKRLAASITGASLTMQLNDIEGWDGANLTASDFGTKAYGVFRNAENTVIELFEWDPSTIASASITILRRGLKFTGDLTTEVSANKLTWNRNETLVELGSHVPQLFQNMVRIIGSPQIVDQLQYSTELTPTDRKDIPTKGYVDDVVNGGTISFNRLVVAGNAGETVSAGQLVYYDTTDDEWKKCDADTAATVQNVMLGIAQGAGTNGNPISGGVLLHGLDENQSGLTAGQIYYASNTAGGVSGSAGTTERAVGISRSTTTLYFDPAFFHAITATQKTFINSLITALPGTIWMYGNATPPSGWLACDGSAVSRTTYSGLFAIIGTTYGAGNGTTTFNVPDLRSSFPLGSGTRTRTFTFDGASAVDPTTDQITVSSNDVLHTGQAVALTGSSLPTGLSATTYYVIRISATVIQLATSVANANAGTPVDITADGSGTCTLTQTLTARSLADTGGEETHALTDGEMPSHTHTIQQQSGGGSNGLGSTTNSQGNGTWVTETDLRAQDAGSDTVHNNMPPYTVVHYIIKT